MPWTRRLRRLRPPLRRLPPPLLLLPLSSAPLHYEWGFDINELADGGASAAEVASKRSCNYANSMDKCPCAWCKCPCATATAENHDRAASRAAGVRDWRERRVAVDVKADTRITTIQVTRNLQTCQHCDANLTHSGALPS